jgi:hypothetical protein
VGKRNKAAKAAEEGEVLVDATVVDPTKVSVAPAKKEEWKGKPGDKPVKIHLPVPCKINGIEYFGTCTVPRKVADALIPMAQKKQKADMRVLVGKNFNVERLLDNTLVIKEES